MATVIDSLLVELGLDIDDFLKKDAEATKAAEKTAAKITNAQKKSNDKRKPLDDAQAKRTRENANEEKKRADATVDGFKKMALQASALFLGFDTLKGFVSLLGNLNSNEAGLGRLSNNLGVNVHEMNTWGLAAERMGGKAADVQGSIAMVSKAITDLNVNAQVDPIFLVAQRLGIDTRDIKDKTKFLLDLGDKLREYSKLHGRDNAFNISGLDATTFNLITADNARALLADAARLNSITETTAAEAAKTQAKVEKIYQRGKNILTEVGHNITGPAVDIVDQVMTATGHQLDALNAAAHGDFSVAYNALKNSFGYGVVTDRAELEDALDRGGDAAGVPREVMRAIALNESNFDPDIISGKKKSRAGATGLMQLMPQTFGNDVGKDTFKDIDKAAAELARLAKHYNGNWVKAAEAYNWGQGNLDHYLAGDINPKTGKPYVLPEETRKYAAKFIAATPNLPRGDAPAITGAGGAGNQTTVTVGQVVVHTQATDANGMAQGAAGAIQKQTMIAQANTAVTQ
jgi:soluble lytic murein transglycosylase-like protein